MEKRDIMRAVFAIADALLEAVQAFGERGVPAGHLYAAVMGRLSLSQFQQIMDALERAGKVTHSGNVYKAK